MSFKNRIGGATLLALATACAGTTASQGPARDVADVQGEHLYRSHCAACHRLREPEEFTATDWRSAVAEHRDDAKLTANDERLILGFLERHAAPVRAH